jgi:hypothetical protein
MQIRFRYIIEDRDRHGNIRIYVRVPGRRKVRIRAPFGTDKFIADYNAAISEHVSAPRQAGAAKTGSFRHVCVLYYASATFKRLDPATQSWRRRALDSMCEKHADKALALMEARHVRALRDERLRSARRCQYQIKGAQGAVRLGLRGEAGIGPAKSNVRSAQDQVRDERPPFMEPRRNHAISRSTPDWQQGTPRA